MSVITDSARLGLDEIRSHVHSNCVVCSPSHDRGLSLAFTASDDGSVEACFACDPAFEGYCGVLHGGVIASLLDGAMTNCMFAHGRPAVTAQLDIRFRHPTTTGTAAVVRAWIDRSSPPLYVLKAEVIQADQVKATACGKFMEQGRIDHAQSSF